MKGTGEQRSDAMLSPCSLRPVNAEQVQQQGAAASCGRIKLCREYETFPSQASASFRHSCWLGITAREGCVRVKFAHAGARMLLNQSDSRVLQQICEDISASSKLYPIRNADADEL